jgi:hypothetical protein
MSESVSSRTGNNVEKQPHMRRLITTMLLCALASVTAHAAGDESRPKVRTITAFVRLDRLMYEEQIDDAMRVLRAARAEFARRG